MGPSGRKRSCNASCYDVRRVKSTKCNCVCGGINHNVGIFKAIENTIALQGDAYWREKHKKVRFTDMQMLLDLRLANS
ncbi:hypothetical protein GCM10011585_29680 [Edaphobacter dinghuensis]|uniref:Uncharacterized protein n=1 Tax=Edaphobacter dinghuensis TaxID=1560005 RepID=A0A917HM56_9BACT|nr:hypothetical protein GCM10011585_29680 [Edaphobacter dinghuensis]